jgi:glucose 1-dehydrogenase
MQEGVMHMTGNTQLRRLAGKYALVTGGATGIGEAIATRLAQEGANVAINYLTAPEQAERAQAMARQACEVIAAHGCDVMIAQADISNEDAVVGMFKQVLERWGRLDILVNNAGIQNECPSDQMATREFDEVVNVNLRGAYLCAREALKHFLSRGGGGVIINDSSVHQLIPKPKFIGYSVSKGGMGNLTRTLALEYADRGIRVNAVGPGAIATPMNEGWVNDPDKRKAVERHIPVGRVGTAEEIAAVVAFLASDDASYITGQTIFADGGLTLYADFRTDWASAQ